MGACVCVWGGHTQQTVVQNPVGLPAVTEAANQTTSSNKNTLFALKPVNSQYSHGKAGKWPLTLPLTLIRLAGFSADVFHVNYAH